MARVKYGGGVTEFIGSIGGTTFQSNGSGFIARSLPKIPKKRTSLQSVQLSSFSYLSQYYRNLSNTDKQDWIDFAAANDHVDYWNNTKTVNGLQWFLVMNSLRLAAGDSITNTTNGNTLPTPVPAYTVDVSNTAIELNSAVAFGGASEILYVWATSPVKSDDSEFRKLLRLVTVIPAATPSPIDITTDWVNTFGLSVSSDLFTPANRIMVALTKVQTFDYMALPFSTEFSS